MEILRPTISILSFFSVAFGLLLAAFETSITVVFVIVASLGKERQIFSNYYKKGGKSGAIKNRAADSVFLLFAGYLGGVISGKHTLDIGDISFAIIIVAIGMVVNYIIWSKIWNRHENKESSS